MTKKLVLSRNHWLAMRRHVSRRAPLEACGLLAGKNDRVEVIFGIRNVDRSPVCYRMEPKAQWRAFQRIEAAGLDLVGIYHSHPNGPDHPSPRDVAESMYPVTQIIWVRVDEVWHAHGFRIDGGKVIEIPIEFIKPE